MSEFQRYQWKVVGRSLSAKQRGDISELSSHISVRSDSAEVSYHWSGFKHDPIAVLKRYFDIHLYEANWGTQDVAFRFDADTVEVADLSLFAMGETLTVVEADGSVLVDAWFEENWIESAHGYYDEYDEADWRLDAFEAIHRQLMDGDYRGIFLLWLNACELNLEENADSTVPLPMGMGQLKDEHKTLADFVGVCGGLMKAAAERSDPLPAETAPQEDLAHHLGKLSKARKEEYLQQLLDGDATAVQSALRRELRSLGKQPRRSRSVKNISYRELADAARCAAEQEARRIKEEKEKRRRDYLAELERREDEIWDRVNERVAKKETKAYDEAVLLLRALEDLWTTRGDREYFLNAVRLIAEEFPRLTGFRGRLEEAGWLNPKREHLLLPIKRERWSEKNPLQREIDLKW
ncbi:hypothetical protein HNR46_002340 [Haloferula luteola]|uniref:Uncharacterized protein n=1 Tax=Haloferula luteola TaxID=595692 RepID=A0A840VE43_9BACT|nr:hypothetical protein [Haloferula luteola]MBB5352099.1 hypothetical protein [Haloferula luteola]